VSLEGSMPQEGPTSTREPAQGDRRGVRPQRPPQRTRTVGRGQRRRRDTRSRLGARPEWTDRACAHMAARRPVRARHPDIAIEHHAYVAAQQQTQEEERPPLTRVRRADYAP
jgi:hypothetical protein